MTLLKRPLAGCVVNLSISESEDSMDRGFPAWQVNRVTLQVVSALFGQGASIVFGHDWREDGVMQAVYGFARQVQAPIPLPAERPDAEREPMLRNLLAWPDEPYLPKRELEQLSSTLSVEQVGLPPELQPVDNEARQSDPNGGLYRYVRARGLTFLRHRLNDACHFRLCLGGRRSDSAGRYPGIVEEAFFAIASKKPLYIASFLGGASQQVVEAIDGKEMPQNFCPPTALNDIYAALNDIYAAAPVRESNAATGNDLLIDRSAVWNLFVQTGRKRLAEINGLTEEENTELLHTPVIDRVIELMLIGLSRVWPALNRRG